MKFILKSLFLTLITLTPMSYLHAKSAKKDTVRCENIISPYKLRVDYLRTPELSVINSEKPVFSWLIPQKSIAQRSYQVLVASSSEKLAQNDADVWDSGRIFGNEMGFVKYEGNELQKGQKYFWKVRFWDYLDNKSEFSNVQEFTVAVDSVSKGSVVSDNPLHIRNDEPIHMKQVADNAYQYDFGKAAFGNIRLDYNAKTNATLFIRAGEQLNSSGRIETKPKGAIRYQEVVVQIRKGQSLYDVLFKKDKRNTGPMAIVVPDTMGVIMPFRYVEVCNFYAKDIEKMKPTRRVMHGYAEPTGTFTSSNALLDSIWEISKYTIQATDFLGYYIDGDRERIPYEADAYINQLCHYAIDSEYAIGKKTLEYFMSNATWPTEWLLHTIMIAYQDYMYTGDTRLIEKYYDILKIKSLHEFAREDGLISVKSELMTKDYMKKLGYKPNSKMVEDIVDWPPPGFLKDGDPVGERDGHEMMDYNTVVNCFFYYSSKIMSELAMVIGKKEDSAYFRHLAAKVKESVNTKLFDKEKGLYIDGEGSTHSSLHSNMMALAFGMVDNQYLKQVGEFVKSRGMACSVYGSQYLFEALYNSGEAQYALDLMTNKSVRSWYNMINIGSTMTLEAWDVRYKTNLDWNHAWGSTPVNLISRMMWGITPTQPGFKKAVIKPQLANLTHSEIVVPTIQGDIKGSYNSENGVITYNFNIPVNMGVNFVLPEAINGIVTLNDEVISNFDTLQLKTGDNKIVIK